jgi:lipopolysaccharide transport system permease protein
MKKAGKLKTKTRENSFGKSEKDKPLVDERKTIIMPKSKWRLFDFRELREYRDLFFFLAWRNIKVLYAQTILGFLWALLVPAIQIIIFTIVFGKVAGVPTDGIPYILFSTVAIIPWTFMSQTIGQSSLSLVENKALLGKVYFPRILFPITPIFSRSIDFGISIIILIGVMVYYNVLPGVKILLLPIFLVQMFLVPATFGLFLSALAIRFRDVKIAMQFLLRMFIYSAPIVYSATNIPEPYRSIYSLNPIVGVIEGFRFSLLGINVPWQYIAISFCSTLILFSIAALYFHRMEHVFVDVI